MSRVLSYPQTPPPPPPTHAHPHAHRERRMFQDIEAAKLVSSPSQRAEMGKLLMHAIRELAR